MYMYDPAYGYMHVAACATKVILLDRSWQALFLPLKAFLICVLSTNVYIRLNPLWAIGTSKLRFM